jgi:hypothetical protein
VTFSDAGKAGSISYLRESTAGGGFCFKGHKFTGQYFDETTGNRLSDGTQECIYS